MENIWLQLGQKFTSMENELKTINIQLELLQSFVKYKYEDEFKKFVAIASALNSDGSRGFRNSGAASFSSSNSNSRDESTNNVNVNNQDQSQLRFIAPALSVSSVKRSQAIRRVSPSIESNQLVDKLPDRSKMISTVPNTRTSTTTTTTGIVNESSSSGRIFLREATENDIIEIVEQHPDTLLHTDNDNTSSNHQVFEQEEIDEFMPRKLTGSSSSSEQNYQFEHSESATRMEVTNEELFHEDQSISQEEVRDPLEIKPEIVVIEQTEDEYGEEQQYQQQLESQLETPHPWTTNDVGTTAQNNPNNLHRSNNDSWIPSSIAFNNDREKVMQQVNRQTSQNPLTCSICHKSFTSGTSLRRHEMIHLPEKPFKCTRCQKRFSRKDHLLTHTRKHLQMDAMMN